VKAIAGFFFVASATNLFRLPDIEEAQYERSEGSDA
jgi:hypothetical protein